MVPPTEKKTSTGQQPLKGQTVTPMACEEKEDEASMFHNLKLRNKILALATIPIIALVVIAVWSAAVGAEPLIAVVAAVGALITLILVWRTASDVARSAVALTDQVDALANEELPASIQRLLAAGAAPGGDINDDTSAGLSSAGDEFGEISRSLTAVQTNTVELIDAQRVALSKGLGEVVEHLTRRSQALLDEQMDLIDWLEATEQDPDRLAQLFELDHLTTRARRAALSVLVLADVEQPATPTTPTPISDLVRVAMGETKHYRNIELRSIDQALVVGPCATDLAHLLAELLDNATRFSPPESPVEVYATLLDDSTFQITVIDRGSGMEPPLLDAANSLISDPPAIELTIGESIGFVVVGRLAARIGAQVELEATAGSGVTVRIVLPAELIVADPAAVESESNADSTPAQSANGDAGGQSGSDALSKLLEGTPRDDVWTPPTVTPAAQPLAGRDGEPVDGGDGGDGGAETSQTLAEAVPTGKAFDSGVQALLDRAAEDDEPTDTDTKATDNGAVDNGAVDPRQADDDSAPSEPDVVTGTKADSTEVEPGTDTGDNVDTGANTETGTSTDTVGDADTGQAGGWTPPKVNAVTGASDLGVARRRKTVSNTTTGPRPVVSRASTRKPEEVRSMISRYRDGMKGQAPPGAGSSEPTESTESTGSEAEAEAESIATTTNRRSTKRKRKRSGGSTPGSGPRKEGR